MLIIVEPEEGEEYNEPPKFEEAPEEEQDWTGNDIDIVLSALQLGRTPGDTTLQFEGTVLGKTVRVLLDGGSTKILQLVTSHLPQSVK